MRNHFLLSLSVLLNVALLSLGGYALVSKQKRIAHRQEAARPDVTAARAAADRSETPPPSVPVGVTDHPELPASAREQGPGGVSAPQVSVNPAETANESALPNGMERAISDPDPGSPGIGVTTGADTGNISAGGPGEAVGGFQARLSSNQAAAPRKQIALPVAFAPVDPALKFSDEQLSQINSLRQSFTDSVGGLDQDPADPAYVQRWEDAQWMSDERFKMLFGAQAFLAQQIQAIHMPENQ